MISRLLVLALMISFSSPLATLGEGKQENEKPLATVNGTAIFAEEAREILSASGLGGNQIIQTVGDLDEQAKNYLIERVILLQEARKSGIEESEDFKRQVKVQTEALLLKAYVSKLSEEFTSEEAIYQYFIDNADEFERPKEYHAAHILVKTKAEAEALLEKLEGGADFTSLAEEHSIDPSAKVNGGDLGFFTAKTMVAPFSKAVQSMEVGALSAPVETQFGWHVIQLHEVREASLPRFEEVQQRIHNRLLETKFGQHLQSLRDKAEITLAE